MDLKNCGSEVLREIRVRPLHVGLDLVRDELGLDQNGDLLIGS